MRLLHTMVRVANLDESIKFYTEVLGMKLLRKNDYPSGKFTLAFVGYGSESEEAVIELTHNWDVTTTNWATPTDTSPSKSTTCTRPATRSRNGAARSSAKPAP